MTARSLLVVFDVVYALALTGWVGSTLFFSFGVEPVIVKALDPAAAARLLRALYPRYYAWGAVCGAIALPASLGAPVFFPEFRGPWAGLRALAIITGTLILLYGGNSLTPALQAACDAGPAGRERFERLHRRSVRWNSVALGLGLALLVAFAARPMPRTAGIIEPTPAERAEREFREAQRAYQEAVKDSGARTNRRPIAPRPQPRAR
ncbi:MAG: DUF4149 domain-containing protein [Isosphaeraceae bacterium]|nr:DUF4149 domain-containing protein [Isosphaeraceae bacterium]